MHFTLTPLLPLTLTLYRLHADAVPRTTQLNFSDLPTEINNDIFSNTDLVAYVTVLDTTRVAPLVTPEVEEKLLCHAAEEVKHLDIYNDHQRARLSHILEATRAIIKRRSALPTTIDPETDADSLKQLAEQFQVTFLEHLSLVRSPTWAKVCMAALLGKDTLVRLLPSFSEGFVDSHMCSMLQAAAVVADFDTLRAVAKYPGFSSSLQGCIDEDAFFSGSFDFVRKIVEFVPEFIQDCSVLETAIRLDHRSLFEYLHEAIKQRLEQHELEPTIGWTLEAIAGRGWVDIFEQLHREYPQCLGTKNCLIAAAEHGRIEILKYLLFHEDLGQGAKTHINRAFEAAVGSGNIDAIKVLLGKDESGNPLFPHLSLTQPSPDILERVGKSGQWVGIEYLMQLKNEGDVRFETFNLAGDASEAVQTACEHGHRRVLSQLLQRDSQGQLVFAFEDPTSLLQESLLNACEQGHPQIVQEILKCSNVDPAANDNEALDIACGNSHHLVVRELLRDNRVDAGAAGGKPLIVACKSGYHLVVRELLQRRDGQYIYNVNPAANDNALLIAACESGHFLVVRELLQHKGVDPDARNNEALIVACRNGGLLVVRELLQHKRVAPDANDNSALIAACENHQWLVVQELLRDKRVNPGARNNHALIAACESGCLPVVQQLLRDNRVDAGVQNGEPLIAACRAGRLHVVQELLRKDQTGKYLYNVDPAARGNQCLIDACKKGHLTIVQFLLQGRPNAHGVIEYEHAGIDAAAQGNRALLEALSRHHLATIKFLLQKTNKGGYVFPGIAITEQMRQIAIYTRTKLLQKRPKRNVARAHAF